MNYTILSLFLTSVLLGNGSAVGQSAMQTAPAAGNWIVSETTSPVDYSPLVVATTRSREGPDSSVMELSAYCRGGHTYLILMGENISRHTDGYVVSYRINGDASKQAGVGLSLFGGVAVPGEIVSLLRSLPDEGEIAIRLATRPGLVREGTFSLVGLKAARGKLAAACKWPPTNAKLRN